MCSAQQNATVAKLRREVINFIKENFESFQYELKNSIYDHNVNSNADFVITNVKEDRQACLTFLENLKQDSEWGGAESLKAVSLIYKKNIIILNENGGIHIPNFSPKYESCVILAYRLASSDTKLIRNHYDSVVNIEESDIYSVQKDRDSVVTVCASIIKRRMEDEYMVHVIDDEQI